MFKISKEKKMKKLMVMVAALAMLASSAYAADWNFYGSARVATFYSQTEVIDSGADNNYQYSEAVQGNSRIGATVKVSDELTGGFEYGTGVNVRKLYGEWNFGAGKLLAGQTYTPLNWFYSDQVYGGDNDLLAQGGLYSGREGMLQLTFGGFKIAVLAPSKANDGVAATATEVKMPGIEATYSMTIENFGVKLGAGYQTYAVTVGAIENDIDSYVLALGANATFGAFYVGANIFGGQNAGNMIAIDTNGTNAWAGGYATLTATEVIDNDAFGAMIAAGFKLNDMFNFEVGYGYVETEYDTAGSTTDKAQSYYLNSTITLAPGVFFVPEIGTIDGDEGGDTQIDYFGIKWQINF
jgi:hypothetical protein